MRPAAGTASDLSRTGGRHRRRGLRALATLAGLVLLAACGTLPPELPGGSSLPRGSSGGGAPASGPLLSQEAEAHRLVNQHRATRGLPPLAYDERIAELARDHSRRMAGGSVGFGHEGFEARAAEIRRFLPAASLAENVALDSRDPPAAPVVRGWIGSAGHRGNLEGSFTVTGIGAARAADGTYYFTQIFAAAR